jgi:FkbM family methyltransferase
MAGLTREHIIWAYRLLLDRDPEDEGVIAPKLRGYGSTADLRRDIMTSEEFADKNPDLAQTNDRNIVIKPLASGVRIFIDLADQAIGLPIIRDQFEQAELAFARRTVGPGQVAIDGGAHVGLFTLHLAQRVGPSGHVYAFEPFPGNADLLRQSIAENQLADRVTLRESALGAASGQAEINYATHTPNSGGAFLLTPGAAGLAGHARLAVAVTALDQMDIRPPVSLLKLDVEGAEPLVIAGASALLARDRPTILCEVHYEQLARVSNATPDDLFGQLVRLGYRAYEITHDGGLGVELEHPPTVPVSTVAFVSRKP